MFTFLSSSVQDGSTLKTSLTVAAKKYALDLLYNNYFFNDSLGCTGSKCYNKHTQAELESITKGIGLFERFQLLRREINKSASTTEGKQRV